MNAVLLRRLAIAATLLALVVIVFGAFVRLSNAGLSCPDWPTCYGKITWPDADHEVAHANATFERAVETHKAWREQVHRHLAATLGLLVLGIALVAARAHRRSTAVILGAAALVALSIPLYIKQQYGLALALATAGELVLAVAALRWGGRDHARLGNTLLIVIVFQALLGMWTVTWLLKPIVVTAHLVGGLTTFALLAWLSLRLAGVGRGADEALPRRALVVVGLVLLSVQIALGGWTSANYAAWACGTDIPQCLGQWWPLADYREAFVLWRGIGVDYEGGVLDGPARTAIQMVHRLFALLVTGHLLVVVVRLMQHPAVRGYGIALLLALGTQIALGIANVRLGLPLPVAVAHSAGAALLLFVLIAALARLSPRARA
jgi:cytochrome c oxidase assembly protein subunit 15